MNQIEQIKAEIERKYTFLRNWLEGEKRRQRYTNGISAMYYKMLGSKNTCESIIDFINSLPKEKPSEDLEKHISEKLYALGADLKNHKPYSFNRGVNVGMSKAYNDILKRIKKEN